MADISRESVRSAMLVAIAKAVQGARAMGYAWCEVRDARLADGLLVVQIQASDEAPPGALEHGANEDDDASDAAPEVETNPAPGARIWL